MRSLDIAALAALLASCNGLLDLDEAHLDPTIGAAGTAGSSGNGGTSSEAGADTGGGEAGAPAASPCEQYCQAVTNGCTGDNTQYTNLEACLVTCPHFPEGKPGDTSGNTLHCRLNYARKAPSEPVSYCTWAGPGGDGKCGSNCEGFCALMSAACKASTTSAETDYFPSDEACLSTCAALPALGGYCATDTSITGGADTLECRLYHVAAGLYADDPSLHCPHAMGLALCVDK